MEPTSFKKDTKLVDPPLDVDKPHLNVSTSTTTNLNETCSLDTSCYQLLHLDPPSHSSNPQDISSVENVEIEFLPKFEVQLDYANLSPTDVFLGHHDYDLFLLNQEIDTPSDNLNFQNTHACENDDVILIHTTNLSHTFVLTQFMAQHNYEGLKPTDNPSTVPTAIQASNDHPFNPWCAHNPVATQCDLSKYPNLDYNFAQPQLMAQPNFEDLDPTDTPSAVRTTLQASSDHTFNPKCVHNLRATQCNQSQYLTSLNKICAHNPSASQNNQISLCNSLASAYPPDPGEHISKRFATEVSRQGFSVKWFKFIHPSPKPRMTETTVHQPVHVAYSPIASMKYQWTVNLHDGYPHLQVLLPEECIPPSLHNLCNFKPTMFHLDDDYLCHTKMLLSHEDKGERLLANVTIKVVEDIEKANSERNQNQSYNFGTGNCKLEKIISYSQHVDHQEPVTNEENKTNDDLYKLRASIGHQGPPRHQTPI